MLDYHRHRGLPAAVVRPGFIYGERDRTVLPKLLLNLRRGSFAYFGSGDQVLNCIYVKNLVEGMFLAAESPAAAGEVFNLTDGQRVTKRQFVGRVAELAGLKPPTRRHPSGPGQVPRESPGGSSQAPRRRESPTHQQGPLQVPRPQPRLFDREGSPVARLSASVHLRARDRARHGRASARWIVETPQDSLSPHFILGGPSMSSAKGKRVAVLVEKFYEDLELWYPVLRLREAGCDVKIVGPKAGETYASKHGYPAKSEVAASEVKASDFDAIVIPGGYSPDHMRRHPAMVDLVTQAARQGKVLAAICHGPWMLCSAKCLQGRKVTGFFAIRDDVENAGGVWQDAACVRDGNLVTSRTPDDLPAFMQGIFAALEGGAQA